MFLHEEIFESAETLQELINTVKQNYVNNIEIYYKGFPVDNSEVTFKMFQLAIAKKLVAPEDVEVYDIDEYGEKYKLVWQHSLNGKVYLPFTSTAYSLAGTLGIALFDITD